MHTLVEVNSGNAPVSHVPAFLAKLWKLVDDPTTNDLIYWNDLGNSFIIRNQAKFARDLLPLYYKHNNMASFVRQLNMYGFHKVVSVEQGGLKIDKDEMEFAHPFFLRGQESSLELIKRKIPTSKHDDSRVRPDSLQKVLMDVRHMKGKQENIDSKLITMKRENEALWRELASLRQKHAKQTQIVSKLLQFLVGMMSSQTHRLGFKRNTPLMLSDAAGAKDRKHSRNAGQTLSGPVIRDVTEIFEADDSGDDQDHSDYLTGSSGSDGDTHPKVDSPASTSSKSPYPESILGLGPDSPEILLAVDPDTVNPSAKTFSGLQGRNPVQDHRIKVKPSKKKTAANSRGTPADRVMSFSNAQAKGTAPTNAQPSSSTTLGQMIHVNNQPLTSFYPEQPGASEPVQFMLSIPDQIPVNGSEFGVNTSAVTTVTQSRSNSQQKQALPSTDMVPLISDNSIGMTRNHNNARSPQYLMKPKVNVDNLDGHLDDMQVGLDNLKDILKSDDYKMDHSTLLGLFGDADLGNFDLSKHIQESQESGTGGEGMSNLSGQELVTYNPSLFELTEDDSQFFDDSSNIFLDDELESMLTTDRNRLSKLQRGSPTSPTSTLSFAAGLNGQEGGNTSSGITTPLGTGPILGTALTTTSTHAGSTVSAANISGAGKRKRK